MHLTDEQLNEYLDHEATDRAQIEIHLTTCSDCAARFNALQGLFSEIESLPELELSPDFAVSILPSPNQFIQLPRSFGLTMMLQAALALVGIILAAPLVGPFILFFEPGLSAPSIADVVLQLQSQWRVWLDILSTLPLPTLPEIPVVNVSNLILMVIVIGVSLLWVVGNGLLLRNQVK